MRSGSLLLTPVLVLGLTIGPQALRGDEHTTDQKKTDTTNSTQTTNDVQASQKFATIESEAREIRQEAARMKTFVRFPEMYNSQIHKQNLALIKDNMNDLAENVKKLHYNRADLEQWQSEMVTQLLPRLETMSNDIGSAIKYVNAHPEWLFRPLYSEYIDGIYDNANAVVRSVDRYLEWAGSPKGKLESAGQMKNQAQTKSGS